MYADLKVLRPEGLHYICFATRWGRYLDQPVVSQ